MIVLQVHQRNIYILSIYNGSRFNYDEYSTSAVMLEDILMYYYNDNVTFSYHQYMCICI